jgi:Xaa-Pro aminopeptidase
MKQTFAARVRRALEILKKNNEPAALVVSSNPQQIRSRDTHYPFRQNSDFFYFTGSLCQDVSLVLNPHSKTPILFITPPKDDLKVVWEGAQPSLKPVVKELRATVVATKDPVKALLQAVRGVKTAYLQSGIGNASSELKRELSLRSRTELRTLPTTVVDSDQLTATLRLYKEPVEVEQIRTAADITSDALLNALPLVRSGVSEREIAAFLDYFYAVNESTAAFNAIVATGRSAATLHYHALNKTLKQGELLLIDTGAEYNMYAADISRTIPVNGVCAPELRDLYEVVLRAQLKAIQAVRPGVTVQKVYDVAANELIYGLRYFGILKGSQAQIKKKGTFKKYFPHGIGHSLGIDVHDVSTGPNDRVAVLEKGMVVTIEPGLYFSQPTGPLPACGVRIEDDILVTARGHEVLTSNSLTKDFDTLCELVGAATNS